MQIRAAIVWEQGAPLSIESAELAPPGPGEVLVEVKAAGVCHSDLHATHGDWPMRLPLVPGHEGAGIVRALGDGVTRVRAGEHVVLCWAPACGTCPPCRAGTPLLCDRLERTTYRNRLPFGGTRLRARDTDLAAFLGTACFATHAVLPEEALVPVADALPFTSLAAVGCAVVTGVGAVTNAAKVPAGAVVAIIGAGGVGLNVVQGAVLAGASRIIAVDTQAAPLAVAQLLGATDVIQPTGPTADAIKQLTAGRGADYVFDTVGTSATLTEAIAAARKGGTIVLTGLSRVDGQGAIAMFPFVMHEKHLIGSVYGSASPLQDIARLVALHQQGRLKLGELATRCYALDQINEALAALAAGEGGRGIITFE
jgi:S-(hydroxymethyl)glutathione dehydrogenase / alcohol dehydrogenase